jgi:DNA-binding GntR family transcriptional regulator
VYLRLRQDILDGQFAPDAVLLETTLAGRYELSRTPVRVALALLEHDGLIERMERGYRVRAGTPQDIMEVYEARIALEARAAATAARRRTEVDMVQLEYLHEQAEANQNPARALGLDLDFHRCVWNASGNRTMIATLRQFLDQLQIHKPSDFVSMEETVDNHREHTLILAAIRDHEAEAADLHMAAHLTRCRDVRLRSVMAQG